jgi:hypothetical protein
MPRELSAAVSWWANAMQEERFPNETSEDHATRCAQSLFAFMHMTDQERNFIIAARDDGVYYRGEKFVTFQMVYEETMKLRNIGAAAYIADTQARLPWRRRKYVSKL